MYILVMDSICKHVQGNYLLIFGRKIRIIMHLIIQNQRKNQADSTPEGMRRMAKLVKIFKTWEVLRLFDPAELSSIAEYLQFRELEQQLLGQEQQAGIEKMYKEHEPQFLPYEVAVRGDFKHGSLKNLQ